MDEAQMVERPSHAAALARQLEATHRWAISGTPISSGLDDIGGLLLFLRASPWDDAYTWRRAVLGPCESGQTIGALLSHHALTAHLRKGIWMMTLADMLLYLDKVK